MKQLALFTCFSGPSDCRQSSRIARAETNVDDEGADGACEPAEPHCS